MIQKIILNIGYHKNKDIVLNGNLHPNKQVEEFKNYLKEGKSEFSTNSIYIIGYITCALKASKLGIINDEYFLTNNFEVEVREFHIEESDEYGILSNYEGLPSDNNLINNHITLLCNQAFSNLLEIEEEQVKKNSYE